MNSRRYAMALAAAVITIAAFATWPCAGAEPVRVLIDRSHEWVFAHDDLSRMLQPAGFKVTMCDASLDAKAKLRDFEIVFVQQTCHPFDFSDEECRLLKEYVDGGGCLVVAGSPKCPVAKLATAFGFTLGLKPCQLPLRADDWLCTSFGAEASLRTRPMSCCVTGPADSRKLIADSSGMPVASMAARGKGKVVCFADDAAYWDFCAQREENLRVPNAATTVALFKCLVPDKKSTGEGPPAVRLSAERELDLPGMLVRYSNPVASRAKLLLDGLPQIAALVAKANGGKPPTEKFIVNILACGGGGWSGGREIGIQCGGSPGSNIAVIAHELTHSWTGPLPGIIGEGWASMVGMRAAKQLGYPSDADQERRSWQEQMDRAESDGKKLDITLADTDRRLFGPCEAKMMWMVERLESKYGSDFVPRFLEICRALKGRESPTIHEVLYYFSLAAGDDLAPSYRKLGIAYKPPPSVAPAELLRALRLYRQKP